MIALVGCAGLPSKERVSRLYGREHPDRKIVRIEERADGAKDRAPVFFDIFYTSATDPSERKDVWQYHAVAEGYIRSP